MESIEKHPDFLKACAKVAQDLRNIANELRHSNEYASHVTEAQKESDLIKSLSLADRIEAGEIKSFTVWQRVNLELTGECVAFLPK